LPAHLAEIGDLPVGQALSVRLCPIEQTGDAGRGQQCMVLGLERGELLTANIGAAPGHHHRSVPA